MIRLLSHKRFVFIAKSLLWSGLLYIACMLALNWNDTIRHIKHPLTTIPVVNTIEQLPEAGKADVRIITLLPG